MSTGARAAIKADKPAEHDMSDMPATWTGNEQIAMLLYPSFTALDLVGPQYMFASLMGAKVHLVAKAKTPVMSDTGMAIVPTATFDQCPKSLDILFVPGGSQGTLNAMQDKATLRFLADRGARAKLVTSVCTGSLVLGAAGLLEGYKATSHWATRDLLTHFGATPTDARVVRDRNRITGAGVTAGLDFGLSIVGQLRDREYAETVQLLAEYAPEPPFSAGSVRTAAPHTKKVIDKMFVGFVEQAKHVSKKSRSN
jgi:cyclohexyl-isocyanide hydratase